MKILDVDQGTDLSDHNSISDIVTGLLDKDEFPMPQACEICNTPEAHIVSVIVPTSERFRTIIGSSDKDEKIVLFVLCTACYKRSGHLDEIEEKLVQQFRVQ